MSGESANKRASVDYTHQTQTWKDKSTMVSNHSLRGDKVTNEWQESFGDRRS